MDAACAHCDGDADGSGRGCSIGAGGGHVDVGRDCDGARDTVDARSGSVGSANGHSIGVDYFSDGLAPCHD
eukprot:138600-Pleurochrysis_carterae.AAC.1